MSTSAPGVSRDPNGPDFAPAHCGGYEVWYLILAEASRRRAWWIRYTRCLPKDPRQAGECALWFVAFDAADPARNLALKEALPAAEYGLGAGSGFRIRVGAGELDSGSARGSIRRGQHAVSWDLRFHSGGEPYHPIPAALRRPWLAKSQVVVPHWNGCAGGVITVDGESTRLDAVPLTQAHIHGRAYGPGWRWAHCNAFEGESGLVAEALQSRVRVAGLLSPALTSFGCAGVGRRHETASLGALLANRGTWTGWQPGAGPSGDARSGADEFCWVLQSRGLDADYRWEIRARARDVVVLEYEGPLGERLHCHNTCVADSLLHIQPHGGPLRTFRSRNTTAIETAR